MLNSKELIAKKTNISIAQIESVLKLLQEGATVPFIARYRKDTTGGLNEEQIELINKDFVYNEELLKRKESILKLLEEKQLLTEELRASILKCETKNELESIYEPFKDGRKTKATEAIALGLEPLAKAIYTQTNPVFNPFNEARKFLTDKVTTVEFALEQASLIIAQWMSQDIEARKIVKKQIMDYGFVLSKKKPKAVDEKETFKNYYEFKQPIKNIPNHRILAIARGEEMKILSSSLEYNEKKIRFDLNNHFFKIKTTGKIILDALDDSLKRLILPSLEREVFSDLQERAEKEAIKLFAENLEQMLLFPAVKGKTVMAIDPAFASGCKVAVVTPEGDVKAIDLIKQNEPFKRVDEATKIVNGLIDKFKVNVIVIGNGTASRETEAFVANVLKNRGDNIPFAIVSEVGASVYSASKLAIKEFPELSVEQRSAIHIGRKFQDPLNELVKVDPKAIGVGQYQHDVNQKELGEALEFKVNKVVNLVGVDVNTATEEILSYIAGITPTLAKNIVEHRRVNGPFTSRKELKDVKGLGPKAFEQAIGFLRVVDSKNFYDKTQIHPESYKLADQVVKALEIDLLNIDKDKLKAINVAALANELSSNEYDIKLIVDSLLEPGKDIRDGNDGPMLKKDVLSLNDVKEGMIFEGTVQNITDFGAFVYIGLKQAALVHVSKMSDKFIKHPSEVVKTGQKVEVEIIGIEKERERIQAKLIK